MRAAIFTVGVLCILWASAFRTPFDGNKDFSWSLPFGGPQISLWRGGAHFAWHWRDATHYLDLRPLEIRKSVISDVAARMLRSRHPSAWSFDPDYDTSFRDQYDAEKQKDKSREWHLSATHP